MASLMPAIGVLIDKTDTKFGKYRPIMVLGNIITVIFIPDIIQYSWNG